MPVDHPIWDNKNNKTKKDMKRNIFKRSKWSLGVLTMAFSLTMTSCSDFFNPNTNDQISDKHYMSENTEMYTGFIGLMTKMQAIGDKEILLTDTRAEMLEPTVNASADLWNVYNYESDLQGNEYASPAPYYELILACNDYLNKVKEYRKQPQVDDEICQNLISSTIRIKVWAYKTIGEIYGEAAWIDEPVGHVEDFLAEARSRVIPMSQVVDKCLQLMDNGFDGVKSDRVVDWIAWLDPSNVTNIANSAFRKWNYIVPTYEGVYAELCLWKGAYIDAANGVGSDAAQPYYKKAADLLLSALNVYINNESYSGNNPYWCPNAGTKGRYQNLWQVQDPYAPEMVCVILYDYNQDQTNSLVRHFNSDAPAEYLLQPSEAGMDNFTNTAKNPGGSSSETRFKNLVGKNGNGYYVAKFRQNGGRNGVRANAYQDDVHIYIYRATQYHLMLCEALNQLNRFTALGCVLNTGMTGDNVTQLVENDEALKAGEPIKYPEWEGFTRNWTNDAEWGTRKYPDTGIRGAYELSARPIESGSTPEQLAAAKRDNDIQILKEAEVEFSCEGKTYPWMNRVAVRYKDLRIVADEVCPKYEVKGLGGQVYNRILAGGNWVKYDL